MDKKPSVLLIDDEDKLLVGLNALMRRNGFETYSAASGSDGIQMARTHLPDVIVCDIMMPPPNGYDVRRELAEDPLTADIPFIFLTARSGQDDKLTGLNEGADDYITKPFDVNELVARVRAVLRRSERSRQRGLKESEEKLDALRHSISANLSHEMRTPLGILINTLELAVRQKFDGRPADLGWYVETALNSAQQLRSLIEDLILLNDIDQGKTNTFREALDLKFNFADVIRNCQERYLSKDLVVVIEVEPGMAINAPRLIFGQIVRHLVDNAFKFSPPGGQVTVNLKSNGSGGCILTVCDQGPGISPDLRGRVFERFYQVSQGDTRDYGGLGLGLYLARTCARTLQGDVVVLDTAQGCCVQLTLPPGGSDWQLER